MKPEDVYCTPTHHRCDNPTARHQWCMGVQGAFSLCTWLYLCFFCHRDSWGPRYRAFCPAGMCPWICTEEPQQKGTDWWEKDERMHKWRLNLKSGFKEGFWIEQKEIYNQAQALDIHAAIFKSQFAFAVLFPILPLTLEGTSVPVRHRASVMALALILTARLRHRIQP